MPSAGPSWAMNASFCGCRVLAYGKERVPSSLEGCVPQVLATEMLIGRTSKRDTDGKTQAQPGAGDAQILAGQSGGGRSLRSHRGLPSDARGGGNLLRVEVMVVKDHHLHAFGRIHPQPTISRAPDSRMETVMTRILASAYVAEICLQPTSSVPGILPEIQRTSLDLRPVLLLARFPGPALPQIRHLIRGIPNRPEVSGEDWLIDPGIDPNAYVRPAPLGPGTDPS